MYLLSPRKKICRQSSASVGNSVRSRPVDSSPFIFEMSLSLLLFSSTNHRPWPHKIPATGEEPSPLLVALYGCELLRVDTQTETMLTSHLSCAVRNAYRSNHDHFLPAWRLGLRQSRLLN
jgi:hypothetical protein